MLSNMKSKGAIDRVIRYCLSVPTSPYRSLINVQNNSPEARHVNFAHNLALFKILARTEIRTSFQLQIDDAATNADLRLQPCHSHEIRDQDRPAETIAFL